LCDGHHTNSHWLNRAHARFDELRKKLSQHAPDFPRRKKIPAPRVRNVAYECNRIAQRKLAIAMAMDVQRQISALCFNDQNTEPGPH
jgi:hypothetical protein